MKKIAAGIVTYNPDISILRANIEAIMPQVEEVVVWDNGSQNINLILSIILNYSKVTLLNDKTNKGIAYALNQLCEFCIKKGYEWILTLDQDSLCPENLIHNLIKYTDDEIVGIIAPQISYKNNEQYYKEKGSINRPEVENVAWVITSASLTRLKGWEEIGGFDCKLFIDKVDYDFCIRLRKKGYEIHRINSVELVHELGKMDCKVINGKVIHVTNHQPFRYYYMTRNTLYLKKKLGQGRPFTDIMKLIIKIVLYEEQKGLKLSSIFHGIIDAKKMRGTT